MSRILIVPSDEPSGTLYRAILRERGHALAFSSPKDALSKLEKHAYEGLIIDINQLDAFETVIKNEGISLLASLRKTNRYANTPCLLGSYAYVNTSILERNLAPVRVFRKPINTSKGFARIVEEYFQRPATQDNAP